MVKVTVDWIEVKYALVRLTVRCIKVIIMIIMMVWYTMLGLARSLIMKGTRDE